MKNLAGNKDCDKYIERELVRSGIDVVQGERLDAEVPASITGKLGKFIFDRRWSYWVVSGDVPLDIAEIFYADPVGREDMRVGGFFGCIPPRECVVWRDEGGRTLYPLNEKPEPGAFLWKYVDEDSTRFVENPEQSGNAFVELYYICSEVGLRLFADTLKKFGLDKTEK